MSLSFKDWVNLESGTLVPNPSESGGRELKIAVWSNLDVEVKRLSVSKTDEPTTNFTTWYGTDNGLYGFNPPGNVNFTFVEIAPWQPLGLYLGEYLIIRKKPMRVEILVKLLFKEQVGWVHLQAVNETDTMNLS